MLKVAQRCRISSVCGFHDGCLCKKQVYLDYIELETVYLYVELRFHDITFIKFMTFCFLRYLGKQLCDYLLLFFYSNSTLSTLEE